MVNSCTMQINSSIVLILSSKVGIAKVLLCGCTFPLHQIKKPWQVSMKKITMKDPISSEHQHPVHLPSRYAEADP